MKSINFKKIAVTGIALVGLGTAAVATTQIAEPTIAQAASSKIKISQSSAIKKFHAKYKKAKIESITLEKEHGRYVYEIEGYTSTREYDMKINASSGKVISHHSEKMDHDDRAEKRAINLKKTISRSTASKIAQKKVSGSKAVEWTLNRSGKRTVWDVTVTKHGNESEVKIDAHTKKVLSVDYDD
ncbi:PepSY domain-containing protein [Lactobacillus kefiranofaciens subsp. kefirgranum]|uniref:PepSY domain-containing protein n=1 Tax=Lactobacillus kefiranofaciens TaxID=267818 RepID=UPI0006D219F8|nr:PepSY domain-containing protein [Lactobacillus kefiranofaciens]KRL30859.1 hypothetical protein FC94_GL000203 [Lactobacillus kefiranofaciens subsp. kefirgranum DSM 10550 = JCM 8572]MDF4142621.1 PepSY domain-containing protein [Lactobacillus kefiranofaciens]MDH5100895.1 PepSY domain-containing protein [Lactobacillus kefiranofaciens]URW70772.1 PepSY domain-containing protein [Lactobacillus kefiranofaciens subsp. kefirgranum]URW72717.1 PepSY domain-containing protein [Lactobacillus kefiranofaci